MYSSAEGAGWRRRTAVRRAGEGSGAAASCADAEVGTPAGGQASTGHAALGCELPARDTMAGVGYYDTVHAGFRHGRTTALGNTFATITPGDSVRCVPPGPPGSPVPGPAVPGVPRPELDFQLAMAAGGFLVVTDGVLAAWTDEQRADLPRFDAADAAAPPGLRLAPADCPVCAAVRAGTVAQYRAALAAELAAAQHRLRVGRRPPPRARHPSSGDAGRPLRAVPDPPDASAS